MILSVFILKNQSELGGN